MKYFFIAGKNPSLSLAELLAVFPSADKFKVVQENIFTLQTDKKIESRTTIKNLGGTIKIGQIKAELKNYNEMIIVEEIEKIIRDKRVEGKFNFGISGYGIKINNKILGMELKKILRKKNVSCRWVTSREPVLSSVVVEQNKLITKGIEIILFLENNKLIIGQTLAVQPFKELSFRDYGRPARDDYSGMLPPKLAQIMINLSKTKSSGAIMDPFCGSGTILTEAMLMGYKNIMGSDISKKAILDTKKNIEWIRKNFQLKPINCKLFHGDATKISKLLKANSIDAVITEPYLGPQRGKFDVEKTIMKLEKLYAESFREFKKILKAEGIIVMVWPVFQKEKEQLFLSPPLSDFKIAKLLPKNLQNGKTIKLTQRGTIIYGRPGQKIWREIIILKRQKALL